MKRTAALALATAMLVLAGCGGQSDPPAAVTVTVTATESASPDPTTETPEETPEPTETSTVTHTPGQTSSRGNIIKALGERAGVTNDGETIWELTVTKIEVGFECTSAIADPPKNGNYIAIHIESQTTPALAEDAYDTTVTFIASDFKVFSPDGTRENDSEGNALWCLDASDELPAFIGPDEKVSGIIVLDSQHESGTIVFQPGVLAGAGGWEWNF